MGLCLEPDCRAPLIYRTHIDRGHGKHGRKGLTAIRLRPLADAAYQQLQEPIVLI